jgi:hypothetical protein
MHYGLVKTGSTIVLGCLVAVTCAGNESIALDHNNGILQVSGRTINHFFQRDVEDSQMIRESIMGASTSGLAQTSGRVTTRLVPNPHQAVVDIELHGTAVMDNNVAQRRAVTIYSSANTDIAARKRLVIDDTGLFHHASQAQCASSIQLHDIDARFRVVERLAWRRVQRLHGQMELAAAQQAEHRAAQHLDNECNPILGDAQSTFQKAIRQPLLRERLWPARLTLNTTSDFVRLAAVAATALQRGAPSDPPSLPGEHDIAVCLHESLFNNVGRAGHLGRYGSTIEANRGRSRLRTRSLLQRSSAITVLR